MRRRQHEPAPGHARPGLIRAVLTVAAGAAVLVAFGLAAPAAPRLAVRLLAAVHGLSLKAHKAPLAGQRIAPAGGIAPIGALFTSASGGMAAGSHFCTASVVNSPAGDVVMTAAHCVSNLAPDQFVFVPEYQQGRAPYGVWSVTRVIVDQDWALSANPDDDVAFLLVRKPGTKTSVQAITGGEVLGIGQPAGKPVWVVGYPNGADTPISCVNRADLFSPTQLEFDCDGYSDGTSGSPLLTAVSPLTGLGTVIGVIGGFQQGGKTASVSYADRLGANVAALYKVATARP
jgi:V8-like Glu-specific endopeptidase